MVRDASQKLLVPGIVGPTAVGKTAVAVRIAESQGWEIVSDSNLKTRGRKEGTTHVLGDVIALHRPKELSEALKRRRIEESEKKRTRRTEELKEEINRLGGKSKGIRYTQDKDDTE